MLKFDNVQKQISVWMKIFENDSSAVLSYAEAIHQMQAAMQQDLDEALECSERLLPDIVELKTPPPSAGVDTTKQDMITNLALYVGEWPRGLEDLNALIVYPGWHWQRVIPHGHFIFSTENEKYGITEDEWSEAKGILEGK